jgi:hypothetical protein
MLANSTDLTDPIWTKDPLLEVAPGAIDPNGGANAFVVTNSGGTIQTLFQQLLVPASYQYCFSLYTLSADATTLTLVRQGPTATATDTFAVANSWVRLISSGRLNDSETQLTVGIKLAPGQQITVYGLQLEAQIQPSRYRPTVGSGGVYPNCHWTSDTLPMTSEAPNLFSTTFAIQTNT